MRGMVGHLCDECSFDLVAGGVAVVEDPAFGMTAFSAEIEFDADAWGPCWRSNSTPFFRRRLDHARSVFDDVTNDVFVAQPRSGIHRVSNVILEGVFGGDHGRDSALGPVGGRIGGGLVW